MSDFSEGHDLSNWLDFSEGHEDLDLSNWLDFFEGDELPSGLDFCEDDLDESESVQADRERKYNQKVKEMKARYEANKIVPVGQIISCACCGKRVLKMNYQTQFCRNKGSGNCKDRYWNNTNDKRRGRAQSVAKYYKRGK